MTPFTLADLATTIAARAQESSETSYTARLLSDPPRAAKKLGEEAVEVVIAAVQNEPKAVIAEAADLLYHLLVVLQASNVSLDDVVAELGRRTHQSGLAEKAARGQPGN